MPSNPRRAWPDPLPATSRPTPWAPPFRPPPGVGSCRQGAARSGWR